MARYGKLGTQYFDDAGDPLISGKLYFYESGTTTEKNTYADVNQSVLNTNPVLLSASGRQPNVFFNGAARVVLTKNDDTQVEVRDPEGGSDIDGVFSPWNSLTLYDVADIVIGSNGNFYISITNGNQDNDPIEDVINWTQIRFIRVWNPNETYATGQIVEASDGLLYSAINDNLKNQNPVGDAVNWKTSTDPVLPSIVTAASKQFAYNNF